MTPEIRSRFSRVLERDEIYLANHSLGRPLDQMAADIREGIDLWYARMDEAWEGWLEEMRAWRSRIARLIGLGRYDAVIPKTSAGQGLRAILNAHPQDRPVPVVTTCGEFDSVDFILRAYQELGRARVHWVEPTRRLGPVPIYAVEPLIEAVRSSEETGGLVVVSMAFFGTGQILDGLEMLVEAAHERGWRVLLDTYHAAGVVPVNLDSLGADFAIGGSYKYLRGGPGACWLAIQPALLDSGTFGPGLDTGWFAKRDTFGYGRAEAPQWAEGGEGWLESTPPVLMPYQARSGLALTLEIGVPKLREESLRQQTRMRRLFETEGVALFEPPDPCRFGAFSLLHHPDASEVSRKLKRHGVNTDARGDFVRFGPDLLTTDDELQKAARICGRLLSGRA